MDDDAEFCWPPGSSLPTNSPSAPMLLTPPMSTRRTPPDNQVTSHRTDSVTYSRLQPQAAEFQTVLDELMSSRTLQDSQVTPHRNLMTYMRLPSYGVVSQTAEFYGAPFVSKLFKSRILIYQLVDINSPCYM